MSNKELQDIFKALSNESRLKILQWLKEPSKHFPPQDFICLRKTRLKEESV